MQQIGIFSDKMDKDGGGDRRCCPVFVLFASRYIKK